MKIEISINNSTNPQAAYVSWAPSPCRARLTDATGAAAPGPVQITLRNKAGGTGGQVVFGVTPATTTSATLSLTVSQTGESVSFFIAGAFRRASTADQDVVVEAVAGPMVVAEAPLMVRVRKDATLLTAGERDRFVAAFAKLNDRGLGRYADFRNMHRENALDEAHGAPGFLPWHRAYLLDLERELQLIDPSVGLPYWRFDRPAAAIFTPDFLGVSDNNGTVSFSPANPLQFWKTDGVQGIARRPHFPPATGKPTLSSEAATLGLGADFAAFEMMEGNPHGLAHTSFGGSLSSPPTAPKDPLFFLLHANVDRLWAKWQRQAVRFDPANASSFDHNPPGGNRIGHNLPDTMWPWNGITAPPRPSSAPGGALAASPCVSAPGMRPVVQDMIDYQGRIAEVSRLGFDYDDVPFN